ncbi:class I SAM-dependent methyltransferase [Mucilaginibacter sp.]|uniref:class I SAM-dependent methyltransferase n=1 Tax=Mucilaginibacter sp. TaxID=1882438 RepID=UPI00283DFCD7|nr:class I SAM-dependent methyltransferase [Mucilaginibacter sp.]MDR3697194.1 class I SAM-dependent methyltransferase [Mucilaginibacter sp.]
MDHIQCPVCGSSQKVKFELKFNVFKCPECGLFTSDANFDFSFKSDLELQSREIGLKKLRFGNFETIIKKLEELKGEKLKGLEIGSGNGWWLKVCQEKGIDCIGIEPENSHQDYYTENGLNVYYGFYPSPEVKSEKGYDFIIFNDVFEHIKELDELIIALKEDLAENGTLIINLPMSDGFFYRSAMMLNKFGITSYLTRMWQFNFHSPHMNYFNQKNLTRLLNRHGFMKAEDIQLDSLDFSTVKERIKADGGVNKLKAMFLSAGISFLKPVILSSKPDIRVFFFNKK